MILGKIATSVDIDYILVEDVTQYGGLAPDRREDYGLALFWSIDDFSYDNSDLTNQTSEYSITSNINGLYYIKTFYVLKWIAGTYTANSLAFHNDQFWLSSTGTSEEPGTGSDWNVIEDYTDFNSNVDPVTSTYSESSEIVESLSNIYKKVGCFTYIVNDATNIAGDKVVTVYNLDNTIATNSDNEDAVYELLDGGSVTIELEPLDSIYILNITGSGIDQSVPIYEFCNYERCIAKIASDILCCEVDPCCLDCDDTKEQWLKAYEAVKLRNLYDHLISMVESERSEFLTIFERSETQDELLGEILQTLEKIQEITNRCADCDGVNVDTNQEPCSSC